ncbi:nucleolin-like isoform X2 [Limulus polyphemus]|uniref:Nucleolin-like isoform X2 n=1 Tax=Limulus polyphemus TaxID=6850 RepID=A0ABM1SSE5_LIMPO|nr:nucleolin-like isoform X2 [Limulus polyphemus]
MVVKTNRQTFQTTMANRKKGAKATEALKKELEKKKLKEEEEEEMESEDSDDEMDEEDSDFDSDVDDEEEEDEEDEEGESFEEDESEDEKSAKGKKALATKSPGKAMTPVQKKQEKLLTPAQKKKAETPKGKAQTPVAKKGMKIREMEEQEDDDDDEDDESFEEDDEEEESGEEKKPVKGKKPETPAQKKNQGKQEMSAQKKIQGKADTPSQKNKKIETPKGIKRKGQDEVKELNAKKAKGLEDEEEDDDDDDEDDDSFEDEEEEESEEEKKPVKGKKPATPAQKKIQGKADTPFQKKNEKTETPKGVKRKGQDLEDVDAKKAKGLEDEAVKMSEERVKERNSRTLFVGQLPADTTLDEVKALSPDITVCRIPMRNGKKSSVYAFVEFNSEKKAEENYEKLQKKTVGGKQIVIDYTGEKSANYKKSPEVNRAVDKKVLFVGSVTCDISLEDLAKVFPNSSQIDFVNPPGCSSGRNVYVKFNTEEEAAEAFSKTGKLKIKGNSLTVLFAHARIRSKNMKTFRKKDFGKRMGQRRQKFQFKKKEESDNDSDDE